MIPDRPAAGAGEGPWSPPTDPARVTADDVHAVWDMEGAAGVADWVRSMAAAPAAGAVPAPPDTETETRTEYRAVSVPTVDSWDLSGEGYRGDSLRAARISAEQMVRHDFMGVHVESRQVTTTTTRTPWRREDAATNQPEEGNHA